MNANHLIPIFFVFLCSCTAHIVKDERVSDPISAFTTGCKKPYQLTQGCSSFWGANSQIELGGKKFAIAGTDDGTVVMIQNTAPEALTNAATTGLLYSTVDFNGLSLRDVLAIVISELEESEISIVKIVPVIIPRFLIKIGKLGSLAAYILELEGDGYAVLSEHAVRSARDEITDDEKEEDPERTADEGGNPLGNRNQDRP